MNGAQWEAGNVTGCSLGWTAGDHGFSRPVEGELEGAEGGVGGEEGGEGGGEDGKQGSIPGCVVSDFTRWASCPAGAHEQVSSDTKCDLQTLPHKSNIHFCQHKLVDTNLSSQHTNTHCLVCWMVPMQNIC